jgi:hypothetical protein
MVEFAFVILPFLALVLGTIDFGMAVFLKATMQHAVREGVRYAVTYRTLEGKCQTESIREIVRRNAMGYIKPDDLEDKVKIDYYLPDTLAQTTDNSPGHIVEVSVVNYQYRWICPLWRSADPLNITSRSSDRMEGLPGGGTKPCQ